MSVKKINDLIWKIVDKSDKKRNQKHLFAYDDVITKKDVKYAKDNDRQILDIYLPKTYTGKLPIIINVPGGGYTAGEKENNRLQSELMARQGFCVLTINYRRSKEEGFPSAVRDLFKVFSFVENKLAGNFDLENVFLMGDSAGAHITSLAAAMQNNHLMQADFEVFSNLKIKACAFFSPSFKIMNIPVVTKGYKKAIYQDNLVYDKVTPVIKVLNTDFPPNIIISPYNDFLILQAVAFANKCKKLGIENQFVVLNKGKALGHVSMIKYAHDSSYINMYDSVFKFFQSKINQQTKENAQALQKQENLVLSHQQKVLLKQNKKTQTEKSQNIQTM